MLRRDVLCQGRRLLSSLGMTTSRGEQKLGCVCESSPEDVLIDLWVRGRERAEH